MVKPARLQRRARARRLAGAVILIAVCLIGIELLVARTELAPTVHHPMLLSPADHRRINGPFRAGDEVELGPYEIAVLRVTDPFVPPRGPGAGSGTAFPLASLPGPPRGDRLIAVDLELVNLGRGRVGWGFDPFTVRGRDGHDYGVEIGDNYPDPPVSTLAAHARTRGTEVFALPKAVRLVSLRFDPYIDDPGESGAVTIQLTISGG